MWYIFIYQRAIVTVQERIDRITSIMTITVTNNAAENMDSVENYK